MKTLISVILYLGLTINSNFKKNILPYCLVILKAELIVDGNISKVSENEYDFQITEFVKGESSKTISIEMWKEWTCDRRIKKPIDNQRLILFLRKVDNGNYKIINGSTGELFIEDDNSVKTYTKTDFFPEVQEVKKGIKLFLKAFSYTELPKEKYISKSYFTKLIKDDEIKAMEIENAFFKSTMKRMKYMRVK